MCPYSLYNDVLGSYLFYKQDQVHDEFVFSQTIVLQQTDIYMYVKTFAVVVLKSTAGNLWSIYVMMN